MSEKMCLHINVIVCFTAGSLSGLHLSRCHVWVEVALEAVEVASKEGEVVLEEAHMAASGEVQEVASEVALEQVTGVALVAVQEVVLEALEVVLEEAREALSEGAAVDTTLEVHSNGWERLVFMQTIRTG